MLPGMTTGAKADLEDSTSIFVPRVTETFRGGSFVRFRCICIHKQNIHCLMSYETAIGLILQTKQMRYRRLELQTNAY